MQAQGLLSGTWRVLRRVTQIGVPIGGVAGTRWQPWVCLQEFRVSAENLGKTVQSLTNGKAHIESWASRLINGPFSVVELPAETISRTG
jgi:hypothetical protein